jgi:hypothetical protein
MIFWSRAARTSGVLAFSSCRIRMYRSVLPNVSKAVLACAFPASAAVRSGGTVAVRCDSYAASHRPSAWAAETSAWPGGRSRPAAINASTRSTLTRDHELVGRRRE